MSASLVSSGLRGIERYIAAAAGHPDVIKAQVELGKLDDGVRSLLDLRGPLAARLNAALGRPAEVPVPWPVGLPEERIEAEDADLLALTKEANPELKALQSDVAKHESAVELAAKRYYPDVTFGMDYVETDHAIMPNLKESGKDPVIASVSINLPVWRESYRAAERQAEARLRSAQRALADRENTLGSDLKVALYYMRDAERKMDLYRDFLIPLAEESLKATEAAYTAGGADFLNLLDAQRMLLEFQLLLERALADHVRRLAEAEMLVGENLPRAKMPVAGAMEERSGTE